MGCWTCQYFCPEGKLCGLGEQVNKQTLCTSLCKKYQKGRSLEFVGSVESQWKYIANPKTLHQLPKKLRTLNKQPVVHYSYRLLDINSKETRFVIHTFVTQGKAFTYTDKTKLETQLSTYYVVNPECGYIDVFHSGGYNEITYREVFTPKNLFLIKHKRKAKRKDKVRLDGRTNWYQEVLDKYNRSPKRPLEFSNPCSEIIIEFSNLCSEIIIPTVYSTSITLVEFPRNI